MATETKKLHTRLLDPVDRISEILFGLIMVVTSTSTVSVVTAGRPEIRTMIIGALGCNLAWGIIDAGMYLLSCLGERARGFVTIKAVREAADHDEANRAIADSLPESLSSVLSNQETDLIREKLLRLPELPPRSGLTKEDALGALAVCLLVFISTFPAIIPFFFLKDVQTALRLSNAVAILMLFMCGYALARHTGLRPWPTGALMVAIGSALVGVAIALGG